MLFMTLAALLATAPPATAHVQLDPVAGERLQLQLCFQGTGKIRFLLDVESISPAGRSNTRQAGTQDAQGDTYCPLRNSLGVQGDTQVHARLHWWLDGVEQPMVENHYPPTRTL